MPTTTGEIEIKLYLSDEIIRAMLELKENQTIFARYENPQFTATRKNGKIEITWEQYVALEFDMSDYAPEWDEP